MRTATASIGVPCYILTSVLASSCGTPTSPATRLSAINVTVRDTDTGGYIAPLRSAPTFFWDGPPLPAPHLQLYATAVYDDGHQEDVTNQVTWQSATSVATISDAGAVTIATIGTMGFTATSRGVAGHLSASVIPCGDFCAQ